jgi:outer membrane immunogenic protein
MFAGRCGLSAPWTWRRSEWQDLITGIEATYTYTNLNTTASSTPIGRIFPAINTQAAVSANGHLDLIDYTEVRARAGYVVGNLLPYGFIGVAMGRANYSVSAATDVTQTILPTSTSKPDYTCAGTGAQTPTCQDFPFSASAGQSNTPIWGFSVGGGLDWALTQNVFLRGEFDFVQFAPISNISLSIISGRVGVGYKF